jgi:hypothetical protein
LNRRTNNKFRERKEDEELDDGCKVLYIQEMIIFTNVVVGAVSVPPEERRETALKVIESYFLELIISVYIPRHNTNRRRKKSNALFFLVSNEKKSFRLA